MRGERINSQHIDSRRERRQAERLAQKNKSADSGRLWTRRNILAAAGIAGVTAISGGGIIVYKEQSSSPVLTESEQIINIFTQTDGKEVNSQEASLWKVYTQQELDAVTDDELLDFTTRRSNTVINSLLKSQVPEFQQAARTYNQYFPSGELVTDAKLSFGTVASDFFMMTQPELPGNIIRERISSNARDLRKIKSDFVLGMLWTHELTHVADQMGIVSDAPASDSPQEKFQYLADSLKLNIVLHEQKAYAAEAKAYIQGRKLGVANDVPQDLIDMAALFIKCNLNKDDPRWVSFVTQRIPAQYLPKEQPKG